MFDQKKILVVVPARGGSKGIKLKNIHPLRGRPLLAYTGALVQTLDCVDRAVVSTDSENIAAVARTCGLDVPFFRPETLSGDRIGDWDVLHHALREMEQQDRCVYDIVVMLQPTCPLRRPEHVTRTIARLVEGAFDAVWTVSMTDTKGHPLKQLVIQEDNRLDYYDPAGAGIIARQQLTPVYHRNGAAYAITRECLTEQKTIKGKRTAALVIEEPLANIDTLDDVVFAEFMLSRMREKEL